MALLFGDLNLAIEPVETPLTKQDSGCSLRTLLLPLATSNLLPPGGYGMSGKLVRSSER